MVSPGGKGIVHLRQRFQVAPGVACIVGTAAEHLVGDHNEVRALSGQLVQSFQNGRSGIFSRPGGVVELVGGQVAQILQQRSSPGRQTDVLQMQGTLHGLKLLCRPHPPVLFHPGGTLGIPHLHGGDVIARKRGFQHQALGIPTLAAGGTAQYQRQHWGVYGVMPPSVKE